jgi:methionyl-tRNA synthetase
MDNILITTAISYTNGSPHIGHLYESVLADFITRSFAMFSNAKLLTGTDEHGKKIQTTAQEQGVTSLELCNENSAKFKQLNQKLGVNYAHFIRTTDQNHKELVIDAIDKSYKSGDIYLSDYTGYYNVREECFVSDLEASQNNYTDPVTGKPYEKVTEESYFFRLEKYRDHINKLLADGLVWPDNKFDLGTRLENLKDLSISRTSFDWGIQFPQFESKKPHVVYVWFDALLNYISGGKLIGSNWDKTIHIIGKDILWFHAVIYPGILQSCGYIHAQAKNILIHGFITDSNGMKMSKSVGNVIEPEELFSKYPIEAIRYYLIIETIWGEDIKFNPDRLKDLYNNQLIKDFGNLFQRLFTLAKPISNELNDWFDKNIILITKSNQAHKIYVRKLLETYDLNQYKCLFLSMCANANKELTVKKPWTSTVDLETKTSQIGNLLVQLKQIMSLLYPIIPEKIIQMCSWIGWDVKSDELKLNITVDKIKAFVQI